MRYNNNIERGGIFWTVVNLGICFEVSLTKTILNLLNNINGIFPTEEAYLDIEPWISKRCSWICHFYYSLLICNHTKIIFKPNKKKT